MIGPDTLRAGGRDGSGLGQVCLKGSNATAGVGVHDQQLTALVHGVSGAKRCGQLVALDLVALKASNQELVAGGGDGHVQTRLRGRSKEPGGPRLPMSIY
jgi:hypothetical protein